jgi:hypothetical protein
MRKSTRWLTVLATSTRSPRLTQSLIVSVAEPIHRRRGSRFNGGIGWFEYDAVVVACGPNTL